MTLVQPALSQKSSKLRDLEAELLSIACSDVEVEPVLQDITEEQLSRGSNRAQDARLDIRARGFWDPQSSAFFDVRVCHPNAESYRDQEPQQIYHIHENDKKRLYSRRVLDVEHGSFTPLVFTTTGGMAKECIRYHSRLAELIAAKKGEQYSQTISWIRARTCFALLSFGPGLPSRIAGCLVLFSVQETKGHIFILIIMFFLYDL